MRYKISVGIFLLPISSCGPGVFYKSLLFLHSFPSPRFLSSRTGSNGPSANAKANGTYGKMVRGDTNQGGNLVALTRPKKSLQVIR